MDLTPAQWLILLGSGGIGYIIQALVGAVKDRNALKHAKPRADVMALSDSLNAQGETVARLTSENTRLAARLSTQGERIEFLEVRYEKLEKECDEREREHERLFQVAIRFITHLIALLPASTTVKIPPPLLQHLDLPDPKELNP